MAGVVDSERGILRQTPFQGWHNLPVREMLQAQMGVPVYVDNDVNTLVVAEQWFGCGQQVSNFLVVTIGRGIGLGIVANHQFYHGARGGAGEFGHTLVDPEGPLCACGKRGCLEAFVGDQGLVAMARAALRQPVATVDELVALANTGSSQAQAVLARAGVILGRAIANLINIFDPQLLLISGEGVRYGHWLLDAMHTAITENVMEALRSDAQIQIEPWGDDDWARGAASLVLRELFEHPVRKEPIHS
jgi:predicted NBD/HSP70 family sugar kinase